MQEGFTNPLGSLKDKLRHEFNLSPVENQSGILSLRRLTLKSSKLSKVLVILFFQGEVKLLSSYGFL